ncbi:ERI1 exoribonuclease 2 [Pleurodeles waltl]|uniref:ERI1 exoribonuclease 2 n=1 Tax=Pleurodeles waltl TaxID=8319 RepID=UPI0037096990
MATKHLAKQLGLIRRSSVTSLNSKNPGRPKSKQFFDYLIIIDFESTCWKDTKHFGQEIIEFPAVLLNTSNGEVESEFHTYVQPQEHPILSEFCTELTGIKQDQVEEGIPLKICLSQFCCWIQKIQTEKKIVFLSATSNHPTQEDKLCAFVTWSDWDLEVCLLYECRRKQIRKPDILNSWIDLRATYKQYYNRKPKGLNGALQDLGITFSGREHSGLDDSRNTARLAWRMICDGCVMKITKSLDKVRPKMNFAARAGHANLLDGNSSRNDSMAEVSENKASVCAENHLNLRKDNVPNPFETGGEIKVLEPTTTVQQPEIDKSAEDHSATQTLLSPQTLINGLSASFIRRPRSYRCNGSMNMPNSIQVGNFSSSSNGNSALLGAGLVLVSTTISSVSSDSDSDLASSSECLSMLADWEDVAVIDETENEQHSSTSMLEETTLCPDPVESTALKSPNETHFYKIFGSNKKTNAQMSPSTTQSIVYKSPNTTIYNVGEVNKQASSSFKLPGLMPNHSNRLVDSKQPFSSLKPCGAVVSNSRAVNHAHMYSTLQSKTTLNSSQKVAGISNVQQSNCSTLLPYFQKRKFPSTNFISPPKKQPFTVYKDTVEANRSLPLSRNPSRTVNSMVLNSSVNTKQSSRIVNNGKITPPLCNCGRRSKRLTVSSIGPNQGRAFYSCPIGKRVEGKKKGCGYFKWEDSFLKETSANSPCVTASSFVSRGTSFISSEGSASSPKRSLGLRPSMRM